MKDRISGPDSESSNEDSSRHRSTKRVKTDTNAIMDRYDYLKKKIKEENAEAYKGKAGQLVLEHLQELDNIYEQIQRDHNTDTKVQLKDAETFMDTSNLAALNARNMNFINAGVALDVDDFVPLLKKYMNFNPDDLEQSYNRDIEATRNNPEALFNSFNWIKLGSLFYSISNKSYPQDFLSIPAEQRKRSQNRNRNVDDTQSTTVTTASQISVHDSSGHNSPTTAHMVKEIYTTFVNKCGTSEVNFFKAFINPFSFSQSVENLFFISFLIKDARLELSLDEQGVPIIKKAPLHMGTEDDLVKRNFHHIASFNYDAWQRLIEKYNIEDCLIGNREQDEDSF